MKAQSAIEYLITYGWMLIAVALASTAIYPLLGQGGCVETMTGFPAGVVEVNDFGVSTNQQLMLQMENSRSQFVQIRQIEIENDDYPRTVNPNNEYIAAGETKSIDLLGVQNSDECNEIDITITYDIGPQNGTKILEGQRTSGTISANFEVIEGERPSPVEDFKAEFN